MSSERTEKASPRRKQRAEQDGDRPRSRELLSASALLAGSLTLGWAARTWLPVWKGTYEDSIALMLAPTYGAKLKRKTIAPHRTAFGTCRNAMAMAVAQPRPKLMSVIVCR